jgi:hypothetical protein
MPDEPPINIPQEGFQWRLGIPNKEEDVLLRHPLLLIGWKTGVEPATSGTTIQRSNQLSYIHRLGVQIYKIF